jgi:hypothetical protein
MRTGIILLILAMLTGCETKVIQPLPGIKPSSMPVVIASSVPKPSAIVSSLPKVTEPVKDGTGKIQQSGDASNAPSPLPTVTPSPEETSSSSGTSSTPVVSPTPSPIPISTPSPSGTPWPTGDRGTPKPRFDQAYPVTEGIRKTDMSVFFKDPAKIRYKTELKEFISLAGADVTNINNLMKQYSIKIVVSDAVYGKTEEQLEKEEKESEAFFGVDFPNSASIYNLYAKTPINVKEFIEALRMDPSVLSANEEGIGGTT